jgi:hypothetical protein
MLYAAWHRAAPEQAGGCELLYYNGHSIVVI